jgi:UDP-3-O-[3-hydroxymyristoyl] glucosamine N-acyltransferase
VVSGVPAIPHKQWMRSQSIVARLPELKKKLNALEKIVQAMKEKGE